MDSGPQPAMVAPQLGEPPRARWTSARARFRARLDHDPRKWVLFIVALGAMAGPMLALAGDRDPAKFGVQHLLFALFLPLWGTAGILGMLLHGRLLLWTGRWLGGAAKPPEIHAAFAWSQLPAALIAAPFLLLAPLRIAAADADPVPGWLQSSLDFVVAVSSLAHYLWLVAMIVGVVLWVVFLAEAQRFALWRALANEVLATLALLLPGLAILFWVTGIHPTRRETVQSLGALAGILAVIGAGVLIERWRARR